MMSIDLVSGGSLRPAKWRSTYILKPDQKVLVTSLATYGWLQPIVANSNNQTIIDGHERWMIAANEKEIVDRDRGLVPVKWVDCDDIDAMVMHVRLNRGRGSLYGKNLSRLLSSVLRSHKYDEVTLRRMLGMQREEFDLLADPGLLKARKVNAHTYSRAWVPVEAPAGIEQISIAIERPPTPDQPIK
jgi:hypothetical protein